MNTNIGNIQIIESSIYNPNKQCVAIPSNNYEFVQWQGDVFINRLLQNKKTNQIISLNIKDPTSNTIIHSIIGDFTSNTQYTIDVLSTHYNAGTITGHGTSYDNTFTLNVVPFDEYNFVEWIGDIIPSLYKHDQTITLKLSKSDPYQAITAVFSNKNEYTTFEYMDGTIIKNKFNEIKATDLIRLNYNVINHTLKKIILGTSVTEIHDYAFANCIALESVQFTDLTHNIIFGQHIFENCTMLTSFDFQFFNNKDIPNYTFYNTGFLTVEFDNITINKIGKYAFSNCKNITKLLNDSTNSGCIKTLDSYAFSDCTKLQNIAFTKILINLGEYSFSNTNIINIDTSNTMFSIIPAYCFYQCNNLVNIKLSTNITTLYDNCFGKCDKLNNIDLTLFDNTIPIISNNASPFPSCVSGSTRKFRFKSNKESLLAYSYDGWKQYIAQFDPYVSSNTILIFDISSKNKQIKFTIYSNNKQVIIDFGDSTTTTIEVCPISGTNIKHTYVNTGQYSVTINDTITSLTCSDKTLISIQNFSHNITSIQKSAFYNCSELTSVFIPITITSIGDGAFANCNKLSLSNITVQNGFNIDNSWIVLNNGTLVDIFKLQSNNITTFDARGTNLKTISARCFVTCNQLTAIYLPNTVQDIQQPILSPTTQLNILTIESGGKYISDNGFLLTNDGKNIIMTISNPSTIPASITTLSAYSFYNTNIQSITIPSTITNIRNKAFYNNTQLTSVTIPLTKRQFDQQFSQRGLCLWFYGGINYLTMQNGDKKIQARRLNIQHSDNTTSTQILLTNIYGYIEKPINKSKVKLTTISLDYIGTTLNPLYGMTEDSDRFKKLLSDFVSNSNITTFKNSTATVSAIKNHLQHIVNTSQDDELFIFHFSGHGGNSDRDDTSHMCLYNGNLHDYEFWNYMQNIKGRVMVIFCCCHSGTMFRSINLDGDTNNYITDNTYADWNKSAYNFFKLKKQLYVSTTESSLDDDVDANINTDSDIIYITDEEDLPSIIVYSACKDEEVSYMDYDIGHNMMTSIVNNFNRSTKLDSYYSLFVNSTTPHEDASLDHGSNIVTPQMTIIGNFNPNIRAFT